MKIVTPTQMRALEEAAIQAGSSEEALMQAAGHGIATALQNRFPEAPAFIFFCGRGHNGGDGRIAAMALTKAGRRAITVDPFAEKMLPWRPLPGTVMVDAIFGTGARPDLPPQVRRLIAQFLQDGLSPVVAIDVPTGVDALTGQVSHGAVTARMTFTCGLPKRGLFADAALAHVGRIQVVPLPLPPQPLDALEEEAIWVTQETIAHLLPRRPWNAHKHRCGRVHLFAGSEGASGAALLAASGALAGGAGLVTLWVPRSIYPIAATGLREAMVRPLDDLPAALASIQDQDAVVAGPGLGLTEATASLIEALLTKRIPLVLDADAIRMIARAHLGHLLHAQVLLTPHGGEMAEWIGETERATALAVACERFPAAVLLKGPSTLVGQRGRTLSFNSTGNPGMASGGMGDLLAGLCGALLAQGMTPVDAGRAAAWLHGAAADQAALSHGEEALLASHLLDHLGSLWTKLHPPR